MLVGHLLLEKHFLLIPHSGSDTKVMNLSLCAKCKHHLQSHDMSVNCHHLAKIVSGIHMQWGAIKEEHMPN